MEARGSVLSLLKSEYQPNICTIFPTDPVKVFRPYFGFCGQELGLKNQILSAK
jgi:hypothetical protein